MAIDLEREIKDFNFFQYPKPTTASEDEKFELRSKLSLDDEMAKIFTLFVSVPYCESRCNSCVFYKNPIGSKDMREVILDSYLEKIIKQIGDYSNTNRFKRANCKSIYVGGGTASLLSLRQLNKLVQAIKNSFRLDPKVEITFEANPLHLTEDYLEGIKRSGANRASLGLQSFNDATLKIIGSPHNATHSFEAISEVMAIGFETVNVDLLYGVPYQEEEQWRTDFEKILEFEPQSITIYRYKVHPGSKSERLIKKGALKKQKDNALLYRFYLLASELLISKCYVEDAFGCFVKPGHEQKYRKYSYKLGCESIGIGAGAYSYINGYLFVSPQNANRFMRNIEHGKYQTADKISLQATQRNMMERYVMHNLNSGSISRAEFSGIFGNDILNAFPNIFEGFEEQGLVDFKKLSIDVTNFGKKYLNNMIYIFYSDEFKRDAEQ